MYGEDRRCTSDRCSRQTATLKTPDNKGFAPRSENACGHAIIGTLTYWNLGTVNGDREAAGQLEAP